MAEIVNLNRARKAKAKQAASVQAAANRALHGQTKAARKAEQARREREKNHHDGLLCDEKHGLTYLDFDQCE